jgi:thioredoxin-like negative regulator of GroEL
MIGVALSCVLQTALLTTGAQPYNEAYQVSQAENRPLLVMVGADWCPGCVTMKQGVLARMQRNGKLRRVAFALVDADREHRLAGNLMRGGSIPQLMMYYKTANGWKSERVVGAQSEATIESMIDRAVSKTVPAQQVTAELPK